jgi:cytohesin
MIKDFNNHDAVRRAFEAAEAEDIGALHDFLTGGGDPDVKNDDGLTLLQFAAAKNSYLSATLLLAGGANPNLSGGEHNYAALHHAAARDNAEMIALLARYDANPDLKDKHGQTPLHVAAWEGNARAAVALTDAGADVFAKDRQGETAFGLAAWKQREVLDFAQQEFIDVQKHLSSVMHEQREKSAAWQSKNDKKLQGDIDSLKRHNPGRFKLGQ